MASILDDHEDTNPGFRARALGPLAAYQRWSAAFGAHRRLFVPLGVLALIALGVHAAADRFDDWAFWLLDFLDGKAEAAYGAFADAVLSRAEERKLAFAALVDLQMKEDAARWLALAVELVVDLRLGIGALGAYPPDEVGYVVPGSRFYHRLWGVVGRRIWRLKRAGRHLIDYARNPSLLKLYLPIAVALATTAGALALFVALDNALFAFSRRLPAAWESWRWLSPWPAVVAALTVYWRLALPAVTGTMARCQRLGQRDWAHGESVPRRLLRGVFGLVLILPLLVLGLVSGTPLGRWIDEILRGGGP